MHHNSSHQPFLHSKATPNPLVLQPTKSFVLTYTRGKSVTPIVCCRGCRDATSQCSPPTRLGMAMRLLFALQARINNKNENMFFLTAKQLSESSVFAQEKKKKNPRKCRALVPACLDVRQAKNTHLIKKVGQHWPQKAPAFAVSWQHFPGIRKTLHSARPSFVCPRLFDRNLTVALLN